MALNTLLKLQGSNNRYLIQSLGYGRVRFLVFQLLNCKDSILYLEIATQNLILDRFWVFSTVVLSPKV